MTLRDRLDQPDRRSEQLPVLVERRDPARRQPRWLERMQRDGLPPKDMTGTVGVVTHMRKHGGYAAQAKRRGEEWIACTECTTHSRDRLRPMQTSDESVFDFLRAFVVFVLLMVAGYCLVLVGAAYAAVPE